MSDMMLNRIVKLLEVIIIMLWKDHYTEEQMLKILEKTK